MRTKINWHRFNELEQKPDVILVYRMDSEATIANIFYAELYERNGIWYIADGDFMLNVNSKNEDLWFATKYDIVWE